MKGPLWALLIFASVWASLASPAKRKATAPARAPISSTSHWQATALATLPEHVALSRTSNDRVPPQVASGDSILNYERQTAPVLQEGDVHKHYLQGPTSSQGNDGLYRKYDEGQPSNAALESVSPPATIASSSSPPSSQVHDPSLDNIIPLSRWEREKAKRTKFKDAWNKLNVDYKDPPDPRNLADSVWNMKVDGIRKSSIGLFAGNLIRKKFPRSYADDYSRRIKMLNNAQKRQRRFEKHGKETRRKTKVDSSVEGPRHNTGIRHKSLDGKRAGKVAERSQRDAQRVIEEVKARGWWKLPVKDLEEVSRGFEMPDAGAAYCTWVIRQHLRDIKRGADADQLPVLRKNIQARMRYGKKVNAAKDEGAKDAEEQ